MIGMEIKRKSWQICIMSNENKLWNVLFNVIIRLISQNLEGENIIRILKLGFYNKI